MEKRNQQHTVIIPSYNTLEHLKNTYQSIKKYAPNVDILIIDDASEDGTKKWLLSLEDKNLTIIISPTRRGHTYWYDEGIKQSTNKIISILHSDMIIGPNYFDNMLKHLERGKVVCATRIEPPIHPKGKEKIIKDFGDEAHNFKWEEFEEFINNENKIQKNITTQGIFAPWMLYKDDHLSIGGHDQRFSPYGYEDSDIFNRWTLEGYEMVQSRDSLCYHMTCRGHKWNKGVGIVNPDYESTMSRCRKEFLRKWGGWIQNNEYQYPIIHPKYDIGIKLKGGNSQLLEILEPWCSNICLDDEMQVITSHYIDKEQSNTIIDLSKKIITTPFQFLKNEIIIEIDQTKFTQQDFQIIQQLPEIIKDSGEIGKFQLGNIFIDIRQMNEYQNELIKI